MSEAPSTTLQADESPSRWEGAIDWYWQHFLKGVCYHFPIILLLVFLLVLPFNIVGEGFGVVQLVWHEDPLKRFMVGAALAVLGLETLFVCYLPWLRDRREGRLGPNAGAALPFASFAALVFLFLVLTCATLAGLWLLVESVGDISYSTTRRMTTDCWPGSAGP